MATTYLSLVNAAITESGADSASFAVDGSDFSSMPQNSLMNRFKGWVSRAWRDIQQEAYDWDFMSEQATVNIDPGFMFYTTDGSQISAYSNYYTAGTSITIYDQDGTPAVTGITANYIQDLTGTSTYTQPFAAFTVQSSGSQPLNFALKPGAEYITTPVPSTVYKFRVLYVNDPSRAYVGEIDSQGNISTTYGTNGYSDSLALGNTDCANQLLADSSGNQYVVTMTGATEANNTIYKLLPTGHKDTTFGTAGACTFTTTPANASVYSWAILAGNYIFVVNKNGTDALLLTRINLNGTVDATFGTSGTLSIANPIAATSINDVSLSYYNGKLYILAGKTTAVGSMLSAFVNSAALYAVDITSGSITTCAVIPIALRGSYPYSSTIPIQPSTNALAVDSTGAYIVGDVIKDPVSSLPIYQTAVCRVNTSTMTVDSSFGTSGFAYIGGVTTGSNKVYSGGIGTYNGSIYVVGGIVSSPLNTSYYINPVVTRITTAGIVDTSFVQSGTYNVLPNPATFDTVGNGLYVRDILFNSSYIYVLGSTYTNNSFGVLWASRVNFNGGVDVTFGNNGLTGQILGPISPINSGYHLSTDSNYISYGTNIGNTVASTVYTNSTGYIHSWKSFDFSNGENQNRDFVEFVQEIDSKSFRVIDFYKAPAVGEVPLTYIPWEVFRTQYDISNAFPGIPRVVTKDDMGRWRFYPHPYYTMTVKFDFVRRPQILTAFSDAIRGLNDDFTEIIMWKALVYFGEYDEQPSIAARATKNYKQMLSRLELKNRAKFHFQPRRMW